jgi:hypothetical protein
MQVFLEANLLFIFLLAVFPYAFLQLLIKIFVTSVSQQLLLVRTEADKLLLEVGDDIIVLIDSEESVLELL